MVNNNDSAFKTKDIFSAIIAVIFIFSIFSATTAIMFDELKTFTTALVAGDISGLAQAYELIVPIFLVFALVGTIAFAIGRFRELNKKD